MKPKAYSPLKISLKADTIRYYGHFSILVLLKGFLLNRTFRPVVTLRLCQAAYSFRGFLRFFLPLCTVLHSWATYGACIDLPWETVVGSGFCIIHGWGLVVSPGAVIGKNITLFHGVTLGRRDRIARDGTRDIGYPVLEDEVWVGPHAVIVGGVTIGRGSRIAAGTFVTENVAPYNVIVGNPAVVFHTNTVPDVTNPAPI
jgi:serine O-acetyltransferase